MNQKTVLFIVICFAIQCISTTSGFSLQFENPKENEPDSEANVSMDLTSILPLVKMIKGQIKGIIHELAFQAFEYIKVFAQDCKVRLLKKLGKYTLSDVFHLIFDGVIEFVKDETSVTTNKYNRTESTNQKPKLEDELSHSEENVEQGYSYDDAFQWSLYHK